MHVDPEAPARTPYRGLSLIEDGSPRPVVFRNGRAALELRVAHPEALVPTPQGLTGSQLGVPRHSSNSRRVTIEERLDRTKPIAAVLRNSRSSPFAGVTQGRCALTFWFRDGDQLFPSRHEPIEQPRRDHPTESHEESPEEPDQ